MGTHSRSNLSKRTLETAIYHRAKQPVSQTTHSSRTVLPTPRAGHILQPAPAIRCGESHKLICTVDGYRLEVRWALLEAALAGATVVNSRAVV